MKQKKVCLIVDHPLRDLEGATLLALQLAKRNIKAYLVPMYQKHEVFLIRPDFVLLNFVRDANKAFVKQCKEQGIIVGVQDTEGGVMTDVDLVSRRVLPLLEGVDLYCLWGKRQYESMAAIYRGDCRLALSGSSRYDFLADPWKEAIENVPYKKFVLINANFPFIDPLFQTMENEIENLVKGLDLPRETVLNMVEQAFFARAEITKTICKLSEIFPDTDFVLRPHPFEKVNFYKENFKDLKNVFVEQKGSVYPWLKGCLLMIHMNCSTAIEALMMGKAAVHLDWIKTPALFQPVPYQMSLKAKNIEDLAELIKKSQTTKLETVAVDSEISKTIEDWFFKNDGGASERIAESIVQILSSSKSSKGTSLITTFSHVTNGYRIRSVGRLGIAQMIGIRNFNKLKEKLFGGKYVVKLFNDKLVSQIVDRLGKTVPEFSGYNARSVALGDAHWNVPLRYGTVVIEAARASEKNY